MARYSDTIDTTEEALREFAENLRKMAADFEAQADSMKEHGLKTIAVSHWKSARDGVAGYAAFAAAIKKAIVLASQMSAVLRLVMQPSIAESQADVMEQRKQSTKGKTTKPPKA